MNFRLLLVGATLAAPAAFAESVPPSPPVIAVVGHGSASRPADWADISFSIRGEGKTSVEALQALADRRKAVEASLQRLAGAVEMRIETGSLMIVEARAPACKGDEDSTPRLSGGACMVMGYIAAFDDTVKVSPAKRAGDGASLAAQLGATNVKLEDSGVVDPSALRGSAAKDAMDDAKRQAEVIATASGLRLGPIVRIADHASSENVSELVVTASRIAAPALAVPAVTLDYQPPPTTRDVNLDVTYSIAPR